MTPTTRLPAFTPQLPVNVATEGTVTTLTLRPMIYGLARLDLTVRLNPGTYYFMTEQGYTLFGARAGHVIVAHPDRPRNTGRIHPMLTGAPDTYQCLYRDGDPSNLHLTNIGFRTLGGYDWWMVRDDGEEDPCWNVEGLAMRTPKAISEKRLLHAGPRPEHTPTPHKVPQFRLDEEAELARLRALSKRPSVQ